MKKGSKQAFSIELETHLPILTPFSIRYNVRLIFAGGPEQIRTDGRAVAVPCLTTWLQGHFAFSL